MQDRIQRPDDVSRIGEETSVVPQGTKLTKAPEGESRVGEETVGLREGLNNKRRIGEERENKRLKKIEAMLAR